MAPEVLRGMDVDVSLSLLVIDSIEVCQKLPQMAFAKDHDRFHFHWLQIRLQGFLRLPVLLGK